MKFFKSHWSNLLFLLIIALLIIPQTRKPMQIQMNRLFSFSPSEISENERVELEDYNWKLRDLDGNITNLKQAKGEIIIINFWATWCPPCIAEMPSLQDIFDRYGKKVNFFFVSSESTDRLKSFLSKKGYHLPVFQSVSEAPELLQSNSLPTTYVLSKTGEIVVKKTGAADWNSEAFHKLLKELLEEKSEEANLIF